WDEAELGQWQTPEDERFGENWYFISYPVPGYTKLATVYDDPEHPNGANIAYKGPFHWLIWNVNNPSQHLRDADEQYLTIIKTDDGRHYIPHIPGVNQQEIDDIGVLEPGRGYFLGFYRSDEFSFLGWEDYPGWPTEGIEPDPKENQNQIASSSHFQYKKYTHWSYPVVVDTLVIEGVEIESGDEIGIFTSAGLCVGASVYEGEFPLVVPTWKDDKATPLDVDGYTDNDEMTIILYDASENEELELDLGPQTQSTEVVNTIASSNGRFGQGSYGISSLIHGIMGINVLPKSFAAQQNYPNPFNSTTVIPLELPQRSGVTIDLFDVCGRLVWTHNAGVQNAGWPKVHFNASNLASGVYFYRVTATGLERGGRYHDVGKMLLLK
ncbi:T9SS type A sorting domain-containing protein, partial [bacterium]|nr:T9SS type A sorting domain-containing protein [bacterium]